MSHQPIINGNRTAEDIVREHYARLQREAEERARQHLPAVNPVPPAPINPPASTSLPLPATPPIVTSPTDYLKLENIQCTDADNNIFEQYSELYVRKDIFRGQNKSQINFIPYQAVVYCEQNGLFLPSMALSCNILAALYQNKSNPEINKILMQYKDHGAGYGWQAQNTVVNYNAQKIIHYPKKEDFPSDGGTTNINTSKSRTELPFKKVEGVLRKKTLENMTLEDGLRHPLVSKFVRQFTGLTTPSILVDIGKYFGKPSKIWFPTSPIKVEDCIETRAAWLGCNLNGNYFNLSANNSLNNIIAVRGVRF